MNIEYGSCYKNVKEAAYNSVSTAMRRYASNMEDDCSYALHRMKPFCCIKSIKILIVFIDIYSFLWYYIKRRK